MDSTLFTRALLKLGYYSECPCQYNRKPIYLHKLNIHSDTAPAKIAKSFLEKLTNNQNLGGVKLLRGYNEVEKETAKKEQEVKKDAKAPDEADVNRKLHLDLEDDKPRLSTDSGDLSRGISPQKKKELEEKEMIQQRAEDYDNEDSEEDVRNIDQIVFVIHGYALE